MEGVWLTENEIITDLLLAFSLLGSTWVLYILVILSVVSVSFIIGKYRTFRRERIDLDKFSSELFSILEKEGPQAAERFLNSFECTESRIIKSILLKSANPGLSREEILSQSLFRERLALEKNLSFLGTLGNNAPFIGLFGTVLGIIKAFHDLAASNSGGPSAVMAGISEALIATAIGLLVAIPAVIAYNYFQRLIKVRLGFSEMIAREVVSVLEKNIH